MTADDDEASRLAGWAAAEAARSELEKVRAELAAAQAVVAQARNVSPRICGAAGVLKEKLDAFDAARAALADGDREPPADTETR